MSTLKSYIGVTGFMSTAEIEVVLGALPSNAKHRLMVGVLASSATLEGKPGHFPNRYPTWESMRFLPSSDPRALNLIHFAWNKKGTLDDQIARLMWGWDPKEIPFHGVQLNIAWPRLSAVYTLYHVLKLDRIVLQVGNGAMRQVDRDPLKLALRVKEYQNLATDVLIDASGGQARPLEGVMALAYLRAIRDQCGDHFALGVAGGLNAGRLHLLTEIKREFPDISIDAEGGLRCQCHDQLSVSQSYAYVAAASEFLSAG